jgi:hypothetical protein
MKKNEKNCSFISTNGKIGREENERSFPQKKVGKLVNRLAKMKRYICKNI